MRLMPVPGCQTHAAFTWDHRCRYWSRQEGYGRHQRSISRPLAMSRLNLDDAMEMHGGRGAAIGGGVVVTDASLRLGRPALIICWEARSLFTRVQGGCGA